jgi:outer membrane biosynthesis protein TonB
MPSAEEIAAQPATALPAQPSVTGQPIAPLVPPTPLAPAGPSESIAPLRGIFQPSPPYPPRALNAEKEGVVRLREVCGIGCL